MAAALVSEEDAPRDQRTRTKNVANDLEKGDRIKFFFKDELDMKCDNAEITRLQKVRPVATGGKSMNLSNCVVARAQVKSAGPQYDEDGHQRYHIHIKADKKPGRRILYSDEKFRRIATAALVPPPPPQTIMN